MLQSNDAVYNTRAARRELEGEIDPTQHTEGVFDQTDTGFTDGGITTNLSKKRAAVDENGKQIYDDPGDGSRAVAKMVDIADLGVPTIEGDNPGDPNASLILNGQKSLKSTNELGDTFYGNATGNYKKTKAGKWYKADSAGRYMELDPTVSATGKPTEASLAAEKAAAANDPNKLQSLPTYDVGFQFQNNYTKDAQAKARNGWTTGAAQMGEAGAVADSIANDPTALNLYTDIQNRTNPMATRNSQLAAFYGLKDGTVDTDAKFGTYLNNDAIDQNQTQRLDSLNAIQGNAQNQQQLADFYLAGPQRTFDGQVTQQTDDLLQKGLQSRQGQGNRFDAMGRGSADLSSNAANQMSQRAAQMLSLIHILVCLQSVQLLSRLC